MKSTWIYFGATFSTSIASKFSYAISCKWNLLSAVGHAEVFYTQNLLHFTGYRSVAVNAWGNRAAYRARQRTSLESNFLRSPRPSMIVIVFTRPPCLSLNGLTYLHSIACEQGKLERELQGAYQTACPFRADLVGKESKLSAQLLNPKKGSDELCSIYFSVEAVL